MPFLNFFADSDTPVWIHSDHIAGMTMRQNDEKFVVTIHTTSKALTTEFDCTDKEDALALIADVSEMVKQGKVAHFEVVDTEIKSTLSKN